MTERQLVHWRIEAVTFIFIVICISLSFYLAFLSFQTLDENLSKQLVTFAASFLITGITIFTALTVHLAIKKAFSRTKDVENTQNRASTTNKINKATIQLPLKTLNAPTKKQLVRQ